MTDVDLARLDSARDRLRASAADRDRYLTVAEIAELVRMDEKTVRRAIRAGRLPAFQPGGRYLVREQDARNWIETRPATTRPRSPRQPRRRRQSASVSELREIEAAMTKEK